MHRLALGFLCVTSSFAVPSLARAQAPLQLAGDGSTDPEERRAARRQKFDERHHLEDYQREHKRKGFYIGTGMTTGMTTQFGSFIPSISYRMEIGGGVTDRITLGISGGLTGHQDIPKGSAGVADVVMQGFIHRGLYMKLGFGATSHAPARGLQRRPGVGGIMGAGYEFRPLRVLGVALGLEYEGRVRTDGVYTQAIVFGLSLRAYLDFHKKW